MIVQVYKPVPDYALYKVSYDGQFGYANTYEEAVKMEKRLKENSHERSSHMKEAKAIGKRLRQLQEEMHERPNKPECSSFHMTFGDARKELISGKIVKRYGSLDYLYLVPAAEYPALTGAAKRMFGENAMVKYESYIACFNQKRGTVSVYTPSTEDILASDWGVVTAWDK